MRALLLRDIRLALRSGGGWVLGTIFMAAFLSLCAIALGGQLSVLRPLATPLIWLSVLFSMLLSFSTIFQNDFQQGVLHQILLTPTSLLKLILAKWVSFLVIGVLPLFIIIPLVGQFFDLSGTALLALMISLGLAAPALAAYVTLAGAILCGKQSAGFLAVLIVMPFLIPLLIFGVDATQSFLVEGWPAVEIRILGGLSLLSIAIGLPASIAALRVNLETT